jgi:Plasmid encoded RepA protein
MLDDFAYMARELVQVTLPHRNPGDVPEWTRRNGNLTLSIRPGWAADRKTGQRRSIGYPYGSIPRLLLFWLTAEAVAAKSRGDHSGRIQLGSSLGEFMFQIGLNVDNGSVGAKRSDARRLRDQMERLFNAVISFEQAIPGDGRHGDHRINMTVASESMLWWSPQDPHQAALWGSWVELSMKFFDAVTAHPVPLDMRALKELKSSPLALDLYSWLSYEAYRAHKSGKGRFVAWKLLSEQMGGNYARTTDFQQKAVATLRKIQALYLRIEPDSLPAITPRPIVTVEQVGTETPAADDPDDELRAATQAMKRALAGHPRGRERHATALQRLQQLIELSEGRNQIEFTRFDGAVLSLKLSGQSVTEPELRAFLQEIYDHLQHILDD